MDLKDAKLIVVLLTVLAGVGYLIFYSPWRPSYGGPAPNYQPERSKPPKVEYVDRDDPRLRYQSERFRNGR